MNYSFGVCPLCRHTSFLFYEVCLLCYAKLEQQKCKYVTPHFCSVCGEPLLHEDAQCQHPVTNHYLHRVFPYAKDVKQLILLYKKSDIQRISHTISHLIQTDYHMLELIYGRILCVPVPCSRQRISATGWDPVTTILRKGGIPFLPLIGRTGSPPQKSLNREQRLHMTQLAYCRNEQMINVNKDCIDEYDAIVLFDDIVTTGSTVRVCIALLEKVVSIPVISFCVAVD